MIGISVDSAYSHQRFKQKYDLPFPLLSDRLASVAEQFGVKHEQFKQHPAVCQRLLFAIDDTDTIRYRWYAEEATDAPTISDIKDAVDWVET